MKRVLAWLVLAGAACAAWAQDGERPAEAKPGSQDDAKAAGALTARVKLETTHGDIVLELFGDKAPITVQNFLRYVKDGHYDGLIFHRIIPTFMIQGGGYTPELQERTERLRDPIKNEWKNGLKNLRGTIAMARTQAPDSATAQFFINVVDNDRLDGPISGGAGYCVFGHVVEGMDVVDKIKDIEVTDHPKLAGMGKVVPVEPVIIKSAKLVGEFDLAALERKIKESAKAEADAKSAGDAEVMREMEKYLANAVAELGKPLGKTDSGIYYFVLKDGTGDRTPKPTDTVRVHYTGWLLDGTKFDSSVDRGEPAQFPLNRVIKGWTEGVGLMKVGEKRRLIIPYELAYGEAGRPPQIPPKSPLVFDVELLEIK